jgi:hypothetical protein
VRQSWARLAARYGWRAYALPTLLAVTVLAVVQNGSASATDSARSGDRRAAAPRPSIAPPLTVRRATDQNVCADNEYAKLAVVSVSRQYAWMCEKHRQVFATPVTTGATVHNYDTPLGSWRVQARERDRDLVGPGYRDHVRYWVPFNGDFGFHDAAWQTMAFGSPDYATGGSHGCVHLPMPAMAWFYGWSRVDQTVVTVEA